MPCTYRILRDNKERGPLGLEELLQLNLKPFDLIWVEGRSAGWRYPSEIDSLKPYLAPVESPAAQPVAAVTHTAVAVSHPKVAVSLPQATPAVPLRSSPAETPVSYNSSAPAGDGEAELTAEALQSKADEIYRRVQAYNQKKEREGEGVETKYARSLEDLKQEYADWLHGSKSKRKGKVGKKQVAIGSSLAAIAAIAVFFFLYDFKEQAAIGLVAEQSLVKSAVKSDLQKNEKNNETAQIPEQQIAEGPSSVPYTSSASGSSVDRFLDSVERVLAQQDRVARYSPKQKTYTHNPVTTNTASITSDVPAPETTAKAAIPVRKVALSKQVSLNARYMHEENRRTISGLEVTVKNNSDVLLREVTVDVFYYRKGEKLFEKETLYFHNIYPHSAITLATPGNKKAITARFQLGQVASGDVSYLE